MVHMVDTINMGKSNTEKRGLDQDSLKASTHVQCLQPIFHAADTSCAVDASTDNQSQNPYYLRNLNGVLLQPSEGFFHS